MNQLIPFDYQSQQVRTVLVNDEPWFVAKDVCDILEIGQTGRAVERLDEDEVNSIHVTDSLGREQITFVVNEPGLYSLILGSRKPEAKAFKRWITHEVIPAIRRTGSYQTKQLSPTEALLQSVQLLAQQEKEIQQLKQAQIQQIEQLTTINHRLDNLDSLDIDGDLQQRLNAMVRRFARKEGVDFGSAWKTFISSYNTAYNANINLSRTYHEGRCGKKFTTPQYLAAVGKLEDAIRVADKMLNKAG